MNTKELMGMCQDYYGLQYTTGMGTIVIRYLDKVPDKLKPHLFARVVKTHSVSFKSLPDVSIFEDAHDIAWSDYQADNPAPTLPMLPAPSDLATDKEVEEFAEWMRAQHWRPSEFKKVKDFKREDRL